MTLASTQGLAISGSSMSTSPAAYVRPSWVILVLSATRYRRAMPRIVSSRLMRTGAVALFVGLVALVAPLGITAGAQITDPPITDPPPTEPPPTEPPATTPPTAAPTTAPRPTVTRPRAT